MMKSVHQGHRARMRSRYLRFGAEAMESHELLELLLYHVVPQRDTNPIAHALLERFGSLCGIFEASKEALVSVEGVGERVADLIIKSGQAAGQLANAPSWEAQDLRYDDYKRLGAYLVSYFSQVEGAATVAVLLDAKMHLISTVQIAALDFSSAGIRAAGIVSYAVRLGASVVVLAHSHPHGPAYPTHGDIVSGELMDKELSDSGVFLLENYIVSGREFVGFHKRLRAELFTQDAVRGFLRSKEEAAR